VLSAQEWALQQWGTVDLGDERLNRRAVEMGMRMAAQPDASLPQQMQDPARLEAAYRMMNNKHVGMQALLNPHCQNTRQAAKIQGVVLWVEDTSELDYTAQAAKSGLGPIGDGKGRGLLLHSTLGVLPESRTVLGLGQVQVVLREATAGTTKRHWTRTPESRLWEASAHALGDAPAGATWVHVSDRGSDSFEYMAACVDHHKHFLLRIFHNRLLTWDPSLPQADQEAAHKLLDYARRLPAVAGSAYTVEVPASREHPARPAEVVLSWAPVTLSPPAQAPAEIRAHAPLSLWVLRAWEPHPPVGVEALEWVLLTSLPIGSLPQAREKINWYTCRWLCEDFHQCLKTGCRIEASQLDARADLERLLGFAAPMAVRLLQLRQEARQPVEVPATQVVDPLMVAVLARLQQISATQLTAREFFRRVARLGGFQGRKRDGEPGWRTLWHGWRYLSDVTEGARLFHPEDTS
jgi:Transposase DNA-binding/Transposase Tn5 dimerisation domain